MQKLYVKRLAQFFAVLAVVAALYMLRPAIFAQSAPNLGKYVDKDGTIHLPENYRLKWVHLGSWAAEGGKQIHDVYTAPEVVEAFRNTGKWPPGATIVKEVRASEEAEMTTGNVHWDGPIVQWFVLVKDADDSFPRNPNWGNGWGWGLFKPNDPTKNISTDFQKDCLGCHVPAKKTDWTYTQGYPILHEKQGPFKTYPKEIYTGK